jgi:RNA polymerase sigma factor (sigma-70 family)
MDDFFESERSGTRAPLFAVGADPAAESEPALRTGDPELALNELHAEYSQKLFSYTLSILRSREDAEDAVQTTFMNAYGSLQAGRAPRQEASWLFRIARNVCLNRIRTQQRKPAGTLEGIDVASKRGMEDALDQRLHVVALRSALERLPEQQRKAIVMRELQGASYAEIATALETTQGAVESLIFRARRQLASALQGGGESGLAGMAA